MYRPSLPNMNRLNVPAELGQAVPTGPELDLISSLSLRLQPKPDLDRAYLAGSVPRWTPIRRDNRKSSLKNYHLLEYRLPSMLRLMQMASNEIHCQRLCERWDGLSFDLAMVIRFEKRLWALNGLKRLDGFQAKGESFSDDSISPKNGGDATKLVEEGKDVLHVCVNEGMACSPTKFFVYGPCSCVSNYFVRIQRRVGFKQPQAMMRRSTAFCRHLHQILLCSGIYFLTWKRITGQTFPLCRTKIRLWI